ncbi:toprim domain-containing protein [Leuconostoc citreum]
MKITKEERAELKKLPIQGYCDWKGIAYTSPSSSEIRMVDHDSLVVRPRMNLFVWNSTGIKGDLVDFIHYYELGKQDGDSKGEAIRQQLAYARYVKGENIDLDKLSEARQPAYQFNYDKVFRTKETNVAKDYLVNQRHLDPQFVERLIQRGEVAQGSKYRENDVLHQNSVIFPWKSVAGKIVGADRQGTETDFEHYQKRGSSKKISPGSDTSTGYNLSFGQGDKTLVLFESPIDLLSYAQQNHQELIANDATLLSISGTDAKRGSQYLNDAIAKKQARFNKIIVAFDNDRAGFKAADYFDRFTFKNPVTNEPIQAVREIPLKGKDWNEQLKAGVKGKQTLTMSENSQRLEELEQIVAQQSQGNPFDTKDQKASALPATNKSTGDKKAPTQRTKAQRRQENRVKNMTLIKEAMAKVTQYQTDPQALKQLLDFTASGLNYSARNSLLIQLQRPDATLLKGYRQWGESGIQVNKGEQGIRIFGAPVDLKTIIEPNGERVRWADASADLKQKALDKELEVKTVKHYPVETVFDVKQTNATPDKIPSLLPNRPIDLATDNSPIHLDQAYQTLKKYADNMSIKVYDQGVDEQLIKRPMTWQGQAKGSFVVSNSDQNQRFILLRSDLTPTDKIHTLAHELGHAKLHDHRRNSEWPQAFRETQAELTSYVITKHLGIEPGEKSVQYISDWSQKLKALDVPQTGKILNQALQASTDITQYLGDHLSQGELRQPKTTQYQEQKKAAAMVQSDNQTMQRHR